MSNLNFIKGQQQYRRQTGTGRILEVATKNNQIYASDGRVYVRLPGGFDDGSTVVRNAPFLMRVQPGISVLAQNGFKVITGIGFDGREEIKGNHSEDLRQKNVNPRQLNSTDASARYKPTGLILDLQSFPMGGDGKIKVFPGIYRKPDGEYGIFSGEEDIEILSTYQPATADKQVVVGVWLDTSTNSITTTGSSEVTAATDLKLAPTTAITYINECAAAAPAGAIGITSYIVDDDDTVIDETNKFHDLRGIVGAGVANTNIVLSKTANYTITGSEASQEISIDVDTTAGDVTITLPTAASFEYRFINISKTDSTVNTVIIDGNGAETINGSLTQTITTQYASVRFQSNGTSWSIR